MSAVDTDLAIEVARLRAELAELRDQLATEVRTRRVVVVDKTDREVIYTDISDTGAEELRVEWGDKNGPHSSAVMNATAETEEGAFDANIYVAADGNIVGWLFGGSAPYEGPLTGDRRVSSSGSPWTTRCRAGTPTISVAT